MLNEQQLARKAIFFKEFQEEGYYGKKAIPNACEALGYKSRKAMYIFIEKGLNDRAAERFKMRGYAKLVKKLQEVG